MRFVAHLDLPKSLEAYYQETGRAGRDGEPAEAWMLYGLGRVVQQRRMIDKDGGGAQTRGSSAASSTPCVGYCESAACRRRVLLGYFGETPAERCENCDTCLTPVADVGRYARRTDVSSPPPPARASASARPT